MENSKIVKSVLMISGIIAIIVGIGILFTPVSFHATTGIKLSSDINLLNEIRASGGGLLVAGILIILGVCIKKLTFTSMIISTYLYLSYGLSRAFSMLVDGTPDIALIQICALEIVVGLVCLSILLKDKFCTK